MIHHILFLRLKARTDESLEYVRQRLLAIEGQLEGLETLEVHIGLGVNEKHFDLCQNAIFTDDAALARYADDPTHLAISADVRPYLESTATIDYLKS